MADRLLLGAFGTALAYVLWLLYRARARERVGTSELRGAYARLQSIVDSAFDGIISIDGSGRIERAGEDGRHAA